MNQLKAKCIIFLALFFPFISFANGGGTYAISSTTGSSDPILRDIKDITLISEKLYIKLNSGRSEVTVNYILWNNSDKDYLDIDYAFPVDYIEVSENSSFRWRDSYMQSIVFLQDGKLLQSFASKGSLLEKMDEESDADFYSGYLFRRWFYTKLNINKQSFVNLQVKYSIENQYLCDGNSPLLLDVLGGCKARKFHYDFSPASHWGDGIIRDFYVEIDASELLLAEEINNMATPKQEEEMDYPENELLATGLPFQKNGDRFTYRTRDFDLKKAQPLKINYTAYESSSIEAIMKYRIPNSQYKITTSTSQKKYPVSNLTDMNLESAWVPLHAIGDWVEFTFTKPIENIAGYTLINGYMKNESTYTQNNRIKELKVEIKHVGKDWKMCYLNSDTIPDEPYTSIYFDNLFHHADYIDFFDNIGENIAVEKVRFTIMDIYPGTKYNETCVSEIMFFRSYY